MKQTHVFNVATAVGGVIAAAAIAAAGAAAATGHSVARTSATKSVTVTVRIEGLYGTLIADRTVTLQPGYLTHAGQGAGQCVNQSVAGALNAATNGNWAGTWSTEYGPDWSLSAVLGHTLTYTTKHPVYWAQYVDDTYDSAGVCDQPVAAGDQVLIAAVNYKWKPGLMTSVTAPARVTTAKAFTVKVYAYATTGRRSPLAKATVSIAGKTYTTSQAGTVKVTVAKAGTYTLTESKAQYVRDEATVKVVK